MFEIILAISFFIFMIYKIHPAILPFYKDSLDEDYSVDRPATSYTKIDADYIKATKKAYLASPEWKYIRKIVLERDNHKCQICGGPFDLSVHHLHYKTYQTETPKDLVTLCQPCHNKVHKRYGYDHNSTFPILIFKVRKKYGI